MLVNTEKIKYIFMSCHQDKIFGNDSNRSKLHSQRNLED